ncbi:hypothetical protein CANCADRAFT_106224 [Tortispora caseinolytica NRRL Y-17796]|uniref:C2 NT-type domain-containing protein n=1 Tax=Tortispora caseinolytica NRRL Y-17796 TaxID=767744 RepID=A0A1E4TFE7_9ASCO|nr:hypothetical protein CANCADRAFT_106224 [Tortispora caseinolytica NRRL Y-17796]
MSLFNSRQPKFKMTLSIIDLVNVPIVSGYVLVKWYLKDSPKPDARGRTDHAPIRDHKVTWDYVRSAEFRIRINSDNVLSECLLVFEIYSEVGAMRHRASLGNLTINVSEHVGKEGQLARRYLLQSSKVNAVIRISIEMTQLKGETNYKVPQLKSSHLFGGIADVAEGQAKEGQSRSKSLQVDDPGFWAKLWDEVSGQNDELTPMACAESIIQGNSGWKYAPEHYEVQEVRANAKMGPPIWASLEDLRSWRVDVDKDELLQIEKTQIAGLSADNDHIVQLEASAPKHLNK